LVFYTDKLDSGNPGYWWFFLGLLDLDGFCYWTYFVCWYKDVEESGERESFSTEGGKCTTKVGVPAAHRYGVPQAPIKKRPLQTLV